MSSFIIKMSEKEAKYICPFIQMFLGTITIWYLNLTVAIFPTGVALKVSTKKMEQIKCKSAFLLCMFSPLISCFLYANSLSDLYIEFCSQNESSVRCLIQFLILLRLNEIHTFPSCRWQKIQKKPSYYFSTPWYLEIYGKCLFLLLLSLTNLSPLSRMEGEHDWPQSHPSSQARWIGFTPSKVNAGQPVPAPE